MIVIEKNRPITAEELRNVFEASGIIRPTQDSRRLTRMIANANVLYTAWAAEKLVGVLRGVSDGAYCCYISDLAVDSDYQHQGIGTALIDALRQELGPRISLVLIAAPKAMDYYPKVGFESVPDAFKIPRK